MQSAETRGIGLGLRTIELGGGGSWCQEAQVRDEVIQGHSPYDQGLDLLTAFHNRNGEIVARVVHMPGPSVRLAAVQS